MRVVIDAPVVFGETVVFRWTQTEPNPFQYENSFSFRYEGIDLTRFSPLLFYEMFLGLQLKVFAAYRSPVDIVFPEPIPRPTVAFWQTFHNAAHLSISPVADVESYSPWAPGGEPETRPRPIGILFGGGKDSTLVACLLSEIYGPDRIVLLQMVVPLRPGTKETARLGRRQEAQMLAPAREKLGVATQSAWTDYLAQHQLSRLRLRPHLELFTVGLLPSMLVWGVSLCTPGLSWTEYAIRRLKGGAYWFRYWKSRPEILADQSTHYRRVLGADIALTNVNLLFTAFSSYRLLTERYPDAFTRIVMCVGADVDKRWCYHCVKCGEYALYGLACGIVDPRFDYDRFFTKSRYIQKVIAYIESGVELSVYGNAPWYRSLCAPVHYLVDCHAISKIRSEVIADRLSPEALGNLLTLKAAFGNHAFPTFESVPAKAVDLLGHDAARRMAEIASEHFDLVDPLPGPFLAGRSKVDYDFGVRMPTPTEQLDHIKA